MTVKLPLNALDTASQAALRDRSTHTGLQAIATVLGLQAALDAKAAQTVVDTKAATADLIATTTGKGAALIGLLGGGTVQKALTFVTPEMFGAVADGVTNDTTALTTAIAYCAANGIPLRTSGSKFAITNIDISTGFTWFADKTTINCLGAPTNRGVIRLTGSGYAILGDLTIDCKSLSERGFETSPTCSNVKYTGRIYVSNLRQGSTEPFNGGVIVDASTGIQFGDITVSNYRQNASTPGFFRAFGCRSGSNVSAGVVTGDTGDMGGHFYAMVGVRVARLEARNLTDNLCYLINATSDVRIGQIDGQNVEEGLVLNCLAGTDANVVIDAVSVRTARNKGLSLRTGYGYNIGSFVGIDAPIGQSNSYTGVTGLRIENVYVDETDPTRRCMELLDNPNISIGNARLKHLAPNGGRLINIQGACDGFDVGVMVAESNPATAGITVFRGVSWPAGVNIRIGTLIRKGVSAVYTAAGLDTTGVRVCDIDSGNTGPSGLIAENANGSGKLTLRSLATSEVLDSEVGRVSVISSDTSASIPEVFAISTKSATATGNFHYTSILSDSGAVAMTIAIGTRGVEFPNGLTMAPLTAAPSYLTAGRKALADRATWDPLGAGSGGAYWVTYSGSAWTSGIKAPITDIIGLQAALDARPVTATTVTASTATLTPALPAATSFALTAQAVALTIAAPTGTPIDGQQIRFRIRDNGTSRAIAWNAIYRGMGVTLLAATVAGKTSYLTAVYNTAETKWDVISLATES